MIIHTAYNEKIKTKRFWVCAIASKRVCFLTLVVDGKVSMWKTQK